MRTFVAWLLLGPIAFGNALLLRVCDNSAPATTAAIDASSQDDEDCKCADGFCPHHHHAPRPQPKNTDENCTCRLSADTHLSLTLTGSPAAILSDPAAAVLMVSTGFTDSTRPQQLVTVRVPTTPPPKA